MANNSKKAVLSFINDCMGKTPDEFSGNLSRLMKETFEFANQCEDDVLFASRMQKAKDNQETRRAYIRALAAYIEGSLNVLKITPYLYPPLLSKIPKKYNATFGESVLPVNLKTSTKENIKSTIKGFAAISEVELSNGFMGEKGGQGLVKVFNIRDNLMHPKSVEGMTVSDSDLKISREAEIWFREIFITVFSPLKSVVRGVG